MSLRRRTFCATPLLACGLPALAQDAARYPSKTINFVVPASAGGPSDVMARLIAERLTPALGQQVIVDNKAGAAQTLGTAFVARAPADGYTMVFTTSTPIVIAPFTKKNLPYDVRKDLVAVSHVGTTPLVMYVHPSLGVSNFKEFLAAARARPGLISYGSYGNGSSAHLLGEFMSKQLGISMIHVPYKGVAPQVQDLVAGQIQMAIADIGVPAPFVKSGQLKVIAVTGSARSGFLPEVPTFAELGVGGMEPFSPWWGLFAPAATPKPIVERMSAEVAKIVHLPELKSRFAALGADPTGVNPTKSAALLEGELTQWQKIIAGLPGINFD